MTSDGQRHPRELLGLAAGGLLDPAERTALQAHLDGCAACRAQLAEITPVARQLSRANPDRVADRVQPTAQFSLRVFAAVAAERRARWRRRVAQGGLVAVAAAVLAIVVPAALGLGIVAAPDPGTPVQFAQERQGVTASATVLDRTWGTQVQLSVAGLDDGETYAVWLERADGSRVPAGTFTADGVRPLSVTLAAAVATTEAVALGISDAAGGTLLRAPLPS